MPDELLDMFKIHGNLFHHLQVDHPSPSYQGTGAVAARRHTLTKQSLKPFGPTMTILIERGLTNRT